MLQFTEGLFDDALTFFQMGVRSTKAQPISSSNMLMSSLVSILRETVDSFRERALGYPELELVSKVRILLFVHR